MKRQEKYPDTEYFKFYNANEKNKIGGDCVIRAVALACSQTWEQTVRELTEMGIKKGLVLNDKNLYPKYLESKGFTQMSEPRDIYDNTKLSVVRFIKSKLNTRTDKVIVVANVGSHHVVCIKDNKVHDIWNSSLQTMHKYWIKKVVE